MRLACIVVSGRKAAVAEVVRIIAAHKIYGTGIVVSIIVVWLCSDAGSIACEREHTQQQVIIIELLS